MKSAVPKKKNNVQSLNEYTSTLSELFGDNLKVRNHIPKSRWTRSRVIPKEMNFEALWRLNEAIFGYRQVGLKRLILSQGISDLIHVFSAHPVYLLRNQIINYCVSG